MSNKVYDVLKWIAIIFLPAIAFFYSTIAGIWGLPYGDEISKTFFALEEENIKILSEFANLSEKEKVEIKSLKRGEALMFVGDDHILTKIECSEMEKEIIEGKKENNENNISM